MTMFEAIVCACQSPSSRPPVQNSGVQELRQRIRNTYEARWKAEKHFNEEEILQELPGALRIQASDSGSCKAEL